MFVHFAASVDDSIQSLRWPLSLLLPFSLSLFDAAGVARNTSDVRWIVAFYNATLCPGAAVPGGNITGMPLSELVAAWTDPFRSTDSVCA